MQFGVRARVNFSNTDKIARARRASAIWGLWKISKCLFIPNCVRKIMWLLVSNTLTKVFALIEGSHTKAYACALSTVTGIPLVRLYRNKKPFDQCDKAVQMSAGYRDYAHATLDLVNEFQWKRVASVYDGKSFDLCKNSPLLVSCCEENWKEKEREIKRDESREFVKGNRKKTLLIHFELLIFYKPACLQKYNIFSRTSTMHPGISFGPALWADSVRGWTLSRYVINLNP